MQQMLEPRDNGRSYTCSESMFGDANGDTLTVACATPFASAFPKDSAAADDGTASGEAGVATAAMGRNSASLESKDEMSFR